MVTADYIVVGSGVTGATLARNLMDRGREVIVLERRSHVGGNVHDQIHESGIKFHTYGPHYFRTASEHIWRYVTRFASFYSYEASLLTYVDGKYQHWPIQSSHLGQSAGPEWYVDFQGQPANFEEAALAVMPRSVYQQFVKGYTEKQWGVAATSLESALARRFEVRHDGDIRLSKHKYQGLPIDGYHFWMQKMLAGIPVFLEHDYLSERDVYRARKMLIFTGPIDEYFGYKYGRLRYRGQKRLHRYFTDVQQYQPGVQVNYPDIDTGPHIRIIEWKHLMPAGSRIFKGTLTTNETPYDPLDPNDFEYPFPDCTNRAVYNLYKAEVVKQDRLLICGRLGEYRYLDMDQAIGRALHLSKDL